MEDPLRVPVSRLVVPALIALTAGFSLTQPFAAHSGLAANFTPVIPTPAPVYPPTEVPATATPVPPTATSVPTVVATSTPSTGTLPQHHVVLLVIDAGQPALFTSVSLPHIQALMKHGVVYDRAYVGQMESTTPGVHVTLGTGTLPKENGFLGFSWVTPSGRKPVDFRSLLADGQIDPVLKSLPELSVAARLHQQIKGAVSIAASGHKDYAAVGLGGGAADYDIYGKVEGNQFVPTFLPGHTPPPLTAVQRKALTVSKRFPLAAEDAWAFRYATTLAADVKPRLLMINLPEMDTWGHWDGPSDKAVFATLMKNIDRGVGTIEDTYRKLGILNNTDFIITADHSMMESMAAHNWPAIQAAAKAAGAPCARADGAAGTIWLDDPTKAKIAADAIVRSRPAHVEAVFYRSSLTPAFHYVLASPTNWDVSPGVTTALQHLVDTTAGLHGPDVWVLYRENYTAVPLNVAGKWKGTHGGATWKTQHVPLVLSGPGIKQGIHSQFPSKEIDIAPTMERLLGLSPIHRDGVILADALQSPLADETAAQHVEFASRSQDVMGLMAQSAWDDTHEQPNVWAGRQYSITRCASKKAHCTIKSPPPTNS